MILGLIFLFSQSSKLEYSAQDIASSPLNFSIRYLPPNATALHSLKPIEKAFLDMIAWAEGTLHADGYNTLFGGEIIQNLNLHPNQCVHFNNQNKRSCSTAFGRYQILNYNAKKMSFTPEEQDKWAIAKLKEIGAIEALHNGDIKKAIITSCKVWSSLPCYWHDFQGYYQQSSKSMASLLNKYEERLQLYQP